MLFKSFEQPQFVSVKKVAVKPEKFSGGQFFVPAFLAAPYLCRLSGRDRHDNF